MAEMDRVSSPTFWVLIWLWVKKEQLFPKPSVYCWSSLLGKDRGRANSAPSSPHYWVCVLLGRRVGLVPCLAAPVSVSSPPCPGSFSCQYEQYERNGDAGNGGQGVPIHSFLFTCFQTTGGYKVSTKIGAQGMADAKHTA